MDIQKEDQKFFIEKGDPGFNPDRNKFIIDWTIKRAEEQKAARDKAFKDDIAERSDALATYFRSRAAESTSTPIDKYFGKKTLAHLRGMKIAEVIKTKLAGREQLVYLPK